MKFLICCFLLISLCSADILLIHDTSRPEAIYSEILQELNITYSEMNFSSDITYNILQNYPVVLLYTNSRSSFFFSSLKPVFERYLEQGGNLIICGKSYGESLSEGAYGNFMESVYGISYVREIFASRIESDWNNPIQSPFYYSLPQPGAAAFTASESHDPFLNRFPCFTSDSFSKKYIISAASEQRSYPDYYRSIYIGFGLEQMAHADAQNLLSSALNWVTPDFSKALRTLSSLPDRDFNPSPAIVLAQCRRSTDSLKKFAEFLSADPHNESFLFIVYDLMEYELNKENPDAERLEILKNLIR